MRYIRRRLLGVLVLITAGVEGLATPYGKPVPVQIVVTQPLTIITLLRSDLVFRSPDYGVHFRKRLWRESTLTTTPLISLEVNGDEPGFLNQQFVFVTRGASLSKPYRQLPTPKVFSDEEKLFKSTYCQSGDLSPVTYYWQTKNGSTAYLTAKDNNAADNNGPSLTVAIAEANTKIGCQVSDLSIIEAPALVTSIEGSGSRPSTAGQIVSYKNGKLMALARRPTVNGNYIIFPVWASCKGNGTQSVPPTTVFIQRVYNAYFVDESGNFVTRTAVTLQHQVTKLFITADVLDDMTLNVRDGLTGVKLESFDDDEPTNSDYRFFAQYHLPSSNATGIPSLDMRGIGFNILCPLYHTRYCLVQSNNTLQLVPLT